MTNFDIVICVALKDCLIVKKTICYLRKYIEAQDIYLITGKSNFAFFSKSYLLKYGIVLIDEESLLPDKEALKIIADKHFTCSYRFGWYYQQFLKMQFALSHYAKDYYIIWGSDTIPLNKLTFFNNGKMVFTPKTEHHKPYFETLEALIGYQKEVDYSYIAEHMIVDVAIMKKLIGTISESSIEGNSWLAKIINAAPTNDSNTFSEFETYGTYCHHNYIDRFTLKEIRTFRDGGRRYSRRISKWKLNKLSKKYDTISLESWHAPARFLRRLKNSLESKYIIAVNYLRSR